MPETWMLVVAGGVAVGLAGLVIIRAKRQRIGSVIVLAGVAAAAAGAWPDARRWVPGLDDAEAIPEVPSPSADTQPGSYPSFFSQRSSRMPPNHPDPSAPRDGPHFTCHENNAR